MKVHCSISLILLIALPAVAGSVLWPTQGGSPGRTGQSCYSGPEQGCIQWQFSTGGSIHTSAAIGSAGQVYVSSEDGFLYAVDPNGTERWRYNAGSPVTSSPTVADDGTIYIGTSDGSLKALDPNGNEKWSFATQGTIYASPAVTGSLVLFGSMDGNLYAADTDGQSAWIFPANHDSIVASPSIGDNGTIYIGRLHDPRLYALNPSNGSIFWSKDLSHPVIPDNPSTNLVQTGYQISPVVHPNGMILISPAQDSKLYALNPANGEIEWSLNLYQFPQKPLNATVSDTVYNANYGYSDIWSEPVVGPDGTIYVSMDDMFLRAVNPNGTLKWIQRLGMYGGFTLMVDIHGWIYAASDDKSLYVLDGQDGTIISVMTFYDTLINAGSARNEEWLSYPVPGADGLIYVSSSRNKVYAIQSGNCTYRDLHWMENLNLNTQVDLEDLVLLSQDWRGCLDSLFVDQRCTPSTAWYPIFFPYLKADLNRDFYVNMDDLTVFVENWLKEESL